MLRAKSALKTNIQEWGSFKGTLKLSDERFVNE